MGIVNLDVNDSLLHFHIELSRRINFIMGNSATGKTSFYNLLERKLNENDEDVNLVSTINIKLLNYSNIGDFSFKSSLCIVDDLDILSNKDFLAQYESMIDRDLWFLIMSREEVDLELKTTLTFSTSCLYKLVSSNKLYHLESLFDLDESTTASDDYDAIIIEDEKGGFEFFSRLYSNVCSKIISSRGKNNICRETSKMILSGFKNILVVYDNASFGSCFYEFYNLARINNSVNIEILSGYECFEELLAQTSLLRHLKDIDYGLNNLEVEANKFTSWEKYFEYLVEKVTEFKPYKYKHKSSLRDCYLESCTKCNSYIKNKCDYAKKENDKMTGLLVDTKYDYLLN